MANRSGKSGSSDSFCFLRLQSQCRWRLRPGNSEMLAPGRKSMTNWDNVLQSRDITMLTKVHIVKAMVFPVVMHGFKSWCIKEAERRRTDAFQLWCWRRMRVPCCWERLRAGGEEGSRGWDGWMALLTQWAWVWANSGRQWKTEKPNVLQSLGSQRVGHDWLKTSKILQHLSASLK